MRRVAVAVLILFGAPRHGAAAEDAVLKVRVLQTEAVEIEVRVVQRDIRTGKAETVAQPRLHTQLGELTGGTVEVPIPADPGREGTRFEQFCFRMIYNAVALQEMKTDVAVVRQVRLEASYQLIESGERRANRWCVKQVETVELGRLIRTRLRWEERGVEYLVEVRVKPWEGFPYMRRW
jgi:hypothetical protein